MDKYSEEVQQLYKKAQQCKQDGDWKDVVSQLQELVNKLQPLSSELVANEIELFEAYLHVDDVTNAVDVLLKLMENKSLDKNQELALLCKLADVQESDDGKEIDRRVQEKLQQGEEEDEYSVRRKIESEWADEGMEQGSDESIHTAFGTLKRIVERSAPDPSHVRYHECYLTRALKAVPVGDLGTMERQMKRVAALRFALKMLEGGSWDRSIIGGCTSTFPFETALRLLEVSEEVMGQARRSSHMDSGSEFTNLEVSPGYRMSQGSDFVLHQFTCDRVGADATNKQQEKLENEDILSQVSERIGLRLAHAFPWNPNGQVQVALAKARRLRPVGICGMMSNLKRSKMIYELKQGLDNGAGGVSGWLQLAELYLDDENPELAIQAAAQGLKYAQKRYEQGHEPLVQGCLFLRLVYARALLDTAKLEEAEQAFNILVDMTSEGGMSLSSIAGLMPVSVRQQALRGLAQVAMKKGDLKTAKFRYEKIMGKAILAHSPTEHWAHAEYGWILFLEANYEEAKVQLETSIVVAENTNACVGELGSYHYKLGRIFWELGGEYRTKPENARQQFINGAKMNGDFQAESFTWLGHYYEQVQKDDKRALQLYQKALALDHNQAANIPNAELVMNSSEGEKIAWWEISNSEQLLKRTNSLLDRITSQEVPQMGITN